MAVMFISQKTLIALLPFLLPVWGKNDWAVPCTSGVCSWDTGNGVDAAWSTIHIVSATAPILCVDLGPESSCPEWHQHRNFRRYERCRLADLGLRRQERQAPGHPSGLHEPQGRL